MKVSDGSSQVESFKIIITDKDESMCHDMKSLHFKSRAIRGVQLGIVWFASHFYLRPKISDENRSLATYSIPQKYSR